jgi:alkylation response protein AidB-like acyl-CoA dehydrogenase
VTVLAAMSEEHHLIAETALRLGNEYGIRQPADLETVDRAKAWSALSETGFLGLRVREGNVPAATGVDFAIVVAALAQSLAPVPYVSTILAVELLELVGAERTLIDAIASGDTRVALALSHDLGGLADPAGDVILLDSENAQLALGVAHRDGSLQVIHCPVDGKTTPLASGDLSRSLARLVGGNVIDAGTLSDEAGDRWLALALVGFAADACGVARAAINNAVKYSKEREQYGVKIGSFQAIQHLCADAIVDIEAASSAMRYASWCIDELTPDEALLAARVAKAKAAWTVRDATETAMQVCGGVGQTREHIAHIHLRRGLLDCQLMGDDGEQLLRIADSRLKAG